MVFENIFYNEQEKTYILFDQEWYKENIPIKFIIYRSINNLYAHNPKIESIIPQNEMLKHYNIKKDEYKKQEEQIQNEVIDTKKQEFYSKQYNFMINSEELKQIIQDVKKLNKDNIELLEGVKELREKIEHKDEIITQQKQLLEEPLKNKIIRKIKEKNKKG